MTNATYSACHLRQSILLTAYETPETRSLFNSDLCNVAGKVRFDKKWYPVGVPDGLAQVCYKRFIFRLSPKPHQNYVRFECTNIKEEADRRFAHFTTQVSE
jgi:U3 small nucleolar RNA-associated protein 25